MNDVEQYAKINTEFEDVGSFTSVSICQGVKVISSGTTRLYKPRFSDLVFSHLTVL
jgi:hypothetical protein